MNDRQSIEKPEAKPIAAANSAAGARTKNRRGVRPSARRVYIDPATPPARSIVRVVVITLLILFFATAISLVLYSLTNLFFLIALAVFFAYLINPLVKLIRRPFKQRNLEKMMPRSLAILLSYLIVFTVVGVSIAYLAPRITEQAKTFATNLPSYTSSVQSSLNDFNRRLDRMRVSDAVQTEINSKITTFLSGIGLYITALLGGLALGLLTYLPWLVLVPILSFFLLKDANLFRVGILRVVPSGVWRTRVESFMGDVNTTLAAYTRAQIISCIIIGFVCTIGFYITGNNYALLLGILAGVFEFVPLLGPVTIAVIATTVSSFESGWQALGTAVFLVVLRVIHDYVTYPFIVRGGIHLHPLAIILSVLAGEQVAGIPGVFIAIPLVALATVLYKHILAHSGSRGLFAGLLEPPRNEELEKI